MARIAFLLDDDFEDSEFRSPHTRLTEAGHEVTVIGSEAKTLTGKRGDVTCVPQLAIGDAAADDFDALVIPGGYSPDKLRTDEDMVRFVRHTMEADKPVAAICHAGSLLIEAGVVAGRRLTSWPSIRTDLRNAGAEVVDEEVVVDGNLITSRNPDDIPAFCAAILDAVGAPARVAG